MPLARLFEEKAAFGEHGLDLRPPEILFAVELLAQHVDEDEGRRDPPVVIALELNDFAHDAYPTEGRVAGRDAERSRMPGSCQRPSGRMITNGSVPSLIASGCGSISSITST